MPASKSLAFTGVRVETHQRFHVFAGRLPAIRLADQRRDDLARARNLFGRRQRPAAENPAPARRIGHAGDRERSSDAEVAQVRQRRDADRVARFGVGKRVIDRRHQIVDRPFETLDERGGHVLRSRLHVDPRRGDVHAVRILLVHVVVDVDQRDAFAVDRNFNLLVAARHAAVQLAGRDRVQHDAEACNRRRPGRCGTATRRRACRTACRRRGTICDCGARNFDGEFGRRRGFVANRDARDLARRPQVTFHQRRRHVLHFRDVVETNTDRVGRQERVDVDVDGQQLAHRTRILGAAQALKGATARIRMQRRRRVDRVFQRGDETIERRPVRGAATPGGGIIPARSFRIIRSVTSACWSACAGS